MQFFGIEEIKDLTKASQTTIEWEAGSNLRIGGQAYNVTSVLTLDTATDIDTGSIASDTIYYIYAIVVAGTVSLKYSLSSSAPAGYSAYRLIGSFGTDGISEIYETNIIAQPVAFVKDVKAANTAGGTATSGSWQTRDLTQLSGDIAAVGVTLSSNQFTLPAGKYLIEWECPAYFIDRHQSRLYNSTDSVTVETGSNEYNPGAGNDLGSSHGSTLVTVTKNTTFQVEHRVQTTRATDGFGIPINGTFTVDKEVYSQVKITRMK